MQVRQRVRRGDLAEHERIVDERAEVIDALHHRHARRRQHAPRHRPAHPARSARPARRPARQTRQRARQHLRARPSRRSRRTASGRRPAHRRHRLLVHPHPAPIDPVLPAPDRPPAHRHAVPPGQRTPVAQPHDRQRLRLRPPGRSAGRAPPAAGSRPAEPRRAPPRRRLSAAALPSIDAQSPAANTKPWLTLRSVASTRTQPAASQASPDAASNAGPTTPVAHSAVATSRKLPSDSASLPSDRRAGLDPAGEFHPGVDQRGARDRSRAQAGALPAARPPCRTSTSRTRSRKRRARASASSVPPGPPPTTAIRAPGCNAASSAASRPGTARSASPARRPPSGIAGTPPTSIDSRSNGTAGRPATATRARQGRSPSPPPGSAARPPPRRAAPGRYAPGRTRIRRGSARAACRYRASPARGRSASAARRVPAHGEPAQHLDMRVAGAQQDEVGRNGHAVGCISPSLAGLRRVARSGEDCRA